MNDANAPLDAVKHDGLATPGDSALRAALGVSKPEGQPGHAARTISFVLELLLFFAALLVPSLVFGDDRYWLPIFTRLMALAIFAMSVDLVWGYTGLLSLGQGLYFGLGAYAVAYCLKMKQ